MLLDLTCSGHAACRCSVTDFERRYTGLAELSNDELGQGSLPGSSHPTRRFAGVDGGWFGLIDENGLKSSSHIEYVGTDLMIEFA